jgi:hypothetical protein
MRRSGSHWDEGAGWVFGSALLMARLRTVVASVLLLRAEAGVCARRRSNFLLAAKRKSPKRRRPPVCVPHRPVGRWGQPAMLGPGVVPQNSLRSSNSAQTAAASQFTKRVCPSAHTPTPGPALLGAARRGGERVPPGCCCAAAPGVGYALRAADGRRSRPGEPSAAKDHGAERSNGPYGALSHPLLTVPRSAGPGVSACRRTRASSSGSPKLFDRSCLAEAAQGVLRRHPRTEHRRLPHSPTGRVGTRAAGSPSLW